MTPSRSSVARIVIEHQSTGSARWFADIYDHQATKIASGAGHTPPEALADAWAAWSEDGAYV